MATSIVQFRVDEDLKNEAIQLYDKLGIDLSTAIRMFLKRSVSVNGIPFAMKLPHTNPIEYASLSESEFNAEIEKGFSDLTSGKLVTAENVAERMQREYGI